MLVAALVVASAVLVPATARAQDCPDADARLSYIQDRLDVDARNARYWVLGWTIGYSTVAVGQLTVGLLLDEPADQAEMFVGAGKSVLGLVPVLLKPVPARKDAGRLRRTLAETPAGPARCALVAEAEAMLRKSAEDEAFARGWLAHTLTVVVNGGGLAIMHFGYDRLDLKNVGAALLGVAVGELAIFTRPSASLRAWRAYPAMTFSVTPMVGGDTTGLWLSGTF